LIEEIARIYGLDKFPPRLPAARQGAARLPHYEAETRLRERLIGLGYREILTIPQRRGRTRRAVPSGGRFAGASFESAFGRSERAALDRHRDHGRAFEWNLNHGQRNARLFEIGRHYRLHGSESFETRVLTIGTTAKPAGKRLYDAARGFSFADLKGDLDSIGELCGGFRGKTAARTGCTRRGVAPSI